MIITDPAMAKKMDRALRFGGYLYELSDIDDGLNNGEMQGHVEGNSWAITQVHRWPKHISVNILFVVGDIEDVNKLEDKIADWAISIGANYLTGIGRDGWWQIRKPGWKKIGTLYTKELTNGRQLTGNDDAS